jgi:hypothetical protein
MLNHRCPPSSFASSFSSLASSLSIYATSLWLQDTLERHTAAISSTAHPSARASASAAASASSRA